MKRRAFGAISESFEEHRKLALDLLNHPRARYCLGASALSDEVSGVRKLLENAYPAFVSGRRATDSRAKRSDDIPVVLVNKEQAARGIILSGRLRQSATREKLVQARIKEEAAQRGVNYMSSATTAKHIIDVVERGSNSYVCLDELEVLGSTHAKPATCTVAAFNGESFETVSRPVIVSRLHEHNTEPRSEIRQQGCLQAASILLHEFFHAHEENKLVFAPAIDEPAAIRTIRSELMAYHWEDTIIAAATPNVKGFDSCTREVEAARAQFNSPDDPFSPNNPELLAALVEIGIKAAQDAMMYNDKQ